MKLNITNTLSGKKELFKPIKENEVSIYVCGVTLYDDIHIGHLKSILSFEVMRNYFTKRNYKVSYIRNITDIDDKIITKAVKEEKSPLDLVNYYINNFHQQLSDLEINPPDIEPRVTTSLDSIVKFIANLQGKGLAYESDDGIYFDTEKMNIEIYPLSKKVAKDLENYSRIDSQDFSKKNKADFALWKQDDNYGFKSNIFKKLGRPGWHIECSAMHYEALGPKFDIHGGGRDLIFPHHENEITQSIAHNGVSPANYWIHNGMMTKDGQKLSKSLGNSIYVKDIVKKYSAEGLKMFLLKGHYASPQEFSDDELLEAHQRWIAFAKDIDKYKNTGEVFSLYENVLNILDDDFNTPLALSYLYNAFKIVKNNNSLEYAEEIFKVLQLLSIVSSKKELKDYLIEEKPSEDVLKLMNERWVLKNDKKYNLADNLRKEILELGWLIKDNANGYEYERK